MCRDAREVKIAFRKIERIDRRARARVLVGGERRHVVGRDHLRGTCLESDSRGLDGIVVVFAAGSNESDGLTGSKRSRRDR